jgi:hypothetical protein
MSMPKVAIVAGALLIILGLGGAAFSLSHGGKPTTALIPFFVGDIFVVLGVLSLAKPSLRKHLMHGLAVVALLGALAAIAPMAIRWGAMSAMARTSTGGMAAICLITLGLCVQSFVAARKARLAGS